jgi:glycosyltransferase involved in cell wall biosynthesis
VPGPSPLARLRQRRRRTPLRVALVGRDATVVAGLRAAGVHLEASAETADVVLVLDPTVPPLKLPRLPLRIGIVAGGTGGSWAGSDTAEDVDALVASTAQDAAVVAPRTVLAPHVDDDVVAGALRAVDDVRGRPRLHVVTGVSNLRMRPRWGDHHYAVAVAKALGRRGWSARSWCQAELPTVDHGTADAVLLLAGDVELRPVADRPTIAWVIYPRELDTGSLTDLHHVHVASPSVAAELASAGVSAGFLPQATDTGRFRPTPGGRHHQLLFVANSRNVRRRITDDLLPTEHELAIYGFGWTPELVDVRHVVADQVPNADLPALYTAADLVLNDHWDEMRAGGYLSNRLFDAAACGAAIVTDAVTGLEDVFADTIAAYHTREDLHRLVDELLADPGRRRDLGDRARETVVAAHTFDHRVDALLASLPGGATA